MNKFKRNIVLVGFNFQEIRSIKIPPIGKNYYVQIESEIFKTVQFQEI